MNNEDKLLKWQEFFQIGKNGWFDYRNFYDFVSDKFEEGVFVELGVWQGMSLTYLSLKNAEKPRVFVYGVDTFKGDPNNDNEQHLINMGQLDLRRLTEENLLRLDLHPILLQFDTVEASYGFEDEECAFVFVDAAHGTEFVQKDIDAWWPKIQPGGILGGHDWEAPSVQAGVRSRFTDFNVMGNCWYITKV